MQGGVQGKGRRYATGPMTIRGNFAKPEGYLSQQPVKYRDRHAREGLSLPGVIGKKRGKGLPLLIRKRMDTTRLRILKDLHPADQKRGNFGHKTRPPLLPKD